MTRRSTQITLSLFALVLGLFTVPSEVYRKFAFQIEERFNVHLASAFITQFFPPQVVDHRGVKYVGTSQSSGLEHFENIFYAHDTSGNNRFAPPVPLRHPKGTVVDATRSGAWCLQGTGDILPFTSQVSNISENCLSLRIVRPSGAVKGAKLPVAVWIHGGGHILGSGSDILYNSDGLVKQAIADRQPLIFVSINYRLGIFGFATSRALIETNSTNVGLRDQRAAFEWIHDHIESFGGDGQKVTAIGQSGGASDISLHLTSYGGSYGAPFHQAIMMSGAAGTNFNTKSDLVANNTAFIAKQLDCVKDNDSQSFETLQCLREAPSFKLANLSVEFARTSRPPFGEAFFNPTYDGDMILDRPSQLIRAGKFVKGKSIIASWVTNEGAWYAPPTTSTDEDVLSTFSLWLTGLSDATKARLLELYPVTDFDSMVRPDHDGPISPQYYRAAQITKDIWFTCPVIDFAWQYVKNGGTNVSDMRLYEHNATRFTPVWKSIGVPMWRVSHLSDIPFVLNDQWLSGGADNSASQLELSKRISRSITNFVTQGAPHHEWPAAFENVTGEELNKPFPDRLSLAVFGGREGMNGVTVDKEEKQETLSQVERAVRQEKLFQRCEFINSEKVREELGV